MYSFYEAWRYIRYSHHAPQLYQDYLIPTEDNTFVLKDKLIDYSDFLCQPEHKLTFANSLYVETENSYTTYVTVGDGAEHDYNNLTDAINYIDAQGKSSNYIYLFKDSNEVISQPSGGKNIYIYGFGSPILSGGKEVTTNYRTVYIYNCQITTAMYWKYTRFLYCYVHDATASATSENFEFNSAYWSYFADITCGDGIGMATPEAGRMIGRCYNCKLEDITWGGNAKLNGYYALVHSENCIFGDMTFNKPADNGLGSSGGYGAWICEDLTDCKWVGTWNFYSTNNGVGTNIQFLNNAKRCVFEGTFNFAVDGSERGNIGSPRGGYVLHGSEECVVGGTWNFADGLTGTLNGSSPNTWISPYSSGGGGFGYGADGGGSSGSGGQGSEGGIRDNTYPGTYNFGTGGSAIVADNNYSTAGGNGGYSGNQNGGGYGGRDLYWYTNKGASCPVSAGSGGVIKNNKDSTFTTSINKIDSNYDPTDDKSLENFRKLRLHDVLTGWVNFDISTQTSWSTTSPDATIKLETDGWYYLVYTGAMGYNDNINVPITLDYDGLTATTTMSFMNYLSASISNYGTEEFYTSATMSGYHMYKQRWSGSEVRWVQYNIKTMAFEIEASDNCDWKFDCPYASPYSYNPKIVGNSTDGEEITIKYTYKYDCEGIEYSVDKTLNWTPS